MSQRFKLGEIVLRAGVIDEFQLESALGEQKKWGGRLGLVLIKLGYVTERDLVNAVASQLNLPVATLDGKKIPRRVLDLIPYDFADDHTCLPLFLKNEEGKDTLYVGMDDPSNLDVLDDLAFRTGMRVKPVVVAASEICEGIDRFYRDLERSSAGQSSAGAESEEAPLSQDKTQIARVELTQACAQQRGGVVDLDKLVGEESGATTAVEVPIDQAPYEANEDTTSPDHEAEKDSDASTRILLHALTQILIENGVVTREEFHQRVRALRGDDESENN